MWENLGTPYNNLVFELWASEEKDEEEKEEQEEEEEEQVTIVKMWMSSMNVVNEITEK